jgi:hypothetical protein
MNKRKDPPRLQDMAHRKICKMIREVGIKWTRRLHSAAVMGQNYWLQETESVDGECVTVRHNLASLPVPLVAEFIVQYAVGEFTTRIASYDNESNRPHINRLYDRQIQRDICANMFKAVLLPCVSRCNIGNTESGFVQELLIQLLYVVPNIKALIFPSKERPNYMQLFVERIQILTQLQEFRFHVGCTTEIIIELSKYCPHLKKLSVQDSRRVDDECVEHLLKLTHLRALNVADTSISNNSFRELLSGLPQVEEVTWFGPVDPVLRDLTVCLPSVRKFVGNVSAAGLLVRKCQNITELVLLSLTEDISDLGDLRSVAELSVLLSSCTVFGFSALIMRLGQTLAKLEMYQVANLNIDDLINYCAALNELILSYCHVTYKETFDRKSPHFQNLKELKLRHNWGPFDFRSVLHLYVNLNILHIVGMGEITDEVIRQIVTSGGWRSVTECVADHCGYLSMITAFLLIKTCPNLTKLGNINSWPGVAYGELETFLNFVRHTNLSLTVC